MIHEPSALAIMHISIEAADNGWVVRWDEKVPNINPGMVFEQPDILPKKMVFKDKETDKAFDLFKSMKIKGNEMKKGQR